MPYSQGFAQIKEGPVMVRVACNIIIVFFMLSSAPIVLSSEAEDADEEMPFRWLAASRETAGVKFPTQKLQSLSPKSTMGTPVEIDEERIEVNSNTTRIIRRTYTTSVNGTRDMIETAVEEIQKLPGDRVRAVRTTSRKDINGRFSPAQQEVQEVIALGDDSVQVTRTLLIPESGGGFVERERIQQTERLSGETSVEIDRTRYESDINGKWSAAERRVSRSTLDGETTQTNEQVYQNDVNNRMALTERVEAIEWMDANGQRHRKTESYTPNLDGNLKLSSRTTITQVVTEDGRQETTEILESADSANPREGLRIVHRMVENLENISQDESSRRLEVFETGLNGEWRSIHSEQSVEAN